MLTLTKRLNGRLVGRRVNIEETVSMTALGKNTGRIANYNTIDGIARQALSGKFGSDPGIRYGDGTYYLPSLQEIQYILQASQLDRRTWMEERFDCDDFSYVLKGEMSAHAYDAGDIRYGLCVGMVWGNFDWVQGYHAVNWFISSDLQLRFIEPQTDEIFDSSHCLGEIGLFVV